MVIRMFNKALNAWYWSEDGIDWYNEECMLAEYKGSWYGHTL